MIFLGGSRRLPAVIQLSGFCAGGFCAVNLSFCSRTADHRSIRDSGDTGSVAERDLPEIRPDSIILDGLEEGQPGTCPDS